MPIGVFFLSALSSALVICIALDLPLFRQVVDMPNARSLHTKNTPRVGSVGLIIAVAIVLGFVNPSASASTMGNTLDTLLRLALVLAVISFVDDVKPLPVLLRLAVQTGVGCAAALGLFSAMTSDINGLRGYAWAITLAVYIVWSTNLFNFMDGANGLAGGMAVVGFGTYAVVAQSHPSGAPLAIASASIAGGALGFLFFNFPKARVFMGDAGSIPLGFLAAALALEGSRAGLWSLWFGPLVFSPFIVDATVTLIRRIVRSEKIWQAHREHYYQRLILSGWSHPKTVVRYYILMLTSALSALFAQKMQLFGPVIILWVITYTLLILVCERRLSQNNKNLKPSGS